MSNEERIPSSEQSAAPSLVSPKVMMTVSGLLPWVVFAYGLYKGNAMIVAFGWFIGFIVMLITFAWAAGARGSDGAPAAPTGRLLLIFTLQFIVMSIGLGIALSFTTFG